MYENEKLPSFFTGKKSFPLQTASSGCHGPVTLPETVMEEGEEDAP